MTTEKILALWAAAMFCIGTLSLIAALCGIGEKNRKKELADLWGG
jgi:hypothetical protein